MPLPARKAQFVAEYLVDLSATRAAIRAGYSGKTAKQAGSRLLQEPAVAEALEEARAAREKRTHISQDRNLRELARIGFSDIRDTVTWVGGRITLRDSNLLSDEAAAAIAEVSETQTGRQRTMKVKAIDKMPALRLLAAHTGVGAGSGELEDDIGADTDPPVVEEEP